MKAALRTQSKHCGGSGSLGGKLGARTLEENRRKAREGLLRKLKEENIKFFKLLGNRNSLKAYKRVFGGDHIVHAENTCMCAW